MKRQRAQELREVFNAFCDGEEIQCQNSAGVFHTNPAENPNFDTDDTVWRIKPKQEVIYVNKHKPNYGHSYIHKSEKSAINSAEGSEKLYEFIAKEFIEVIKD